MSRNNTNHPLFKVGDIITLDNTAEASSHHNRMIAEVRDTGYTWEYLGSPNTPFLSENSNDPFFEDGWMLVGGSSERNLNQAQELNETIQQLKEQGTLDMGELSDNQHTFNELYMHRVVLFATITSQNKAKSWKSHYHHDGTMYPDYFIVGIDTEFGQFSYHFHEKYWGWFDVPALDSAPEFDGHTPDDVTRLLALPKLSPKEKSFNQIKEAYNRFQNGKISRHHFLKMVEQRVNRHNMNE